MVFVERAGANSFEPLVLPHHNADRATGQEKVQAVQRTAAISPAANGLDCTNRLPKKRTRMVLTLQGEVGRRCAKAVPGVPQERRILSLNTDQAHPGKNVSLGNL